MQVVLVRCKDNILGIEATKVREMGRTPTVTALPHAPDFVRGTVNLRTETLVALDLRKRLLLPSGPEERAELLAMIAQREQDHRNWLNALEESVTANTEFTRPLDPRKCAFGKWYYAYNSSDGFFNSYLRRFEAPHEKIHAVGTRVKQLMVAGRHAEALSTVTEARATVLRAMLHLFHGFGEEYDRANQEIMVVVEHEGRSTAILTDAALALEDVTLDDPHALDSLQHDGERIFSGTARRPKSSELLLMVDIGVVVAPLAA